MNSGWSNIAFVNPWMLGLLLLLPVFFYFYQRTKKRQGTYLRFSNLSGLKGHTSWRAVLRKILPFLSALAFASIIIALARPQSSLEEQKVEAEGIDIMMVLDLSPSMLQADIRPNRLVVAKKAALDFVENRKYDRIGLTIFSGEPLTLSPPTTDLTVITQYIQSLQTNMLEDGTAIGDGLISGLNRLKNSESKSKVVILLSDGENNMGYVKPLKAAEVAKTLGVKIYTIGLRVNNAELQEMARLTGGKYFVAKSQNALQRIYAEIDQLEKTKIEVAVVKKYAEKFHAYAWFGIGLLLLTQLLNQTILRALPQ